MLCLCSSHFMRRQLVLWRETLVYYGMIGMHNFALLIHNCPSMDKFDLRKYLAVILCLSTESTLPSILLGWLKIM